MTWGATDEQGRECDKVKFEVVPYLRGEKVLDLGCGPNKAFPAMIGIDNLVDRELFGIPAKTDVTVETCEVLPYKDGEIDAIFSSHLLEHIVDYVGALREWWRVLKKGKFMVLYLPDEAAYPRVGEPHANPDHKWNVNYERVVDAMKSIGSWDLVRFEPRHERNEYSLLFVFQKL